MAESYIEMCDRGHKYVKPEYGSCPVCRIEQLDAMITTINEQADAAISDASDLRLELARYRAATCFSQDEIEKAVSLSKAFESLVEIARCAIDAWEVLVKDNYDGTSQLPRHTQRIGTARGIVDGIEKRVLLR